jgi:glycosyltransferase involved in cell wall biosynthesis
MNMISQWPDRGGARRIQIFVSDLSATGVVRNAIAVANEAAASGYVVRLLTCHPDGELRAQVRPNVTVVKLNDGQDAYCTRRVQMQRALLAYRRHCSDWQPDIMMSAGNHGHLLSSFAWLGLPGRKVLRISNDLAHGSPPLMKRFWRAAKFWLMASLADQLVYVSRAQESHPLLARHMVDGKATVIPNGVDIDAVRVAAQLKCDHPWAEDSSIPIALAVGRHAKQKNFDALLRAFAEARARQPMRLIILGDGEQAETERLKKLALHLCVERAVDFVPPTPNPFPYMAAARTLLLPSLWEGSANVLLEAMACGTPVIASRTAGDAEHVLGGGQYGLVVDPRDIGQLAAAIVRQMGEDPLGPRDRAVSFSRSAAMRQYIRLFDKLADSRKGIRPRFTPAAASPASPVAHT